MGFSNVVRQKTTVVPVAVAISCNVCGRVRTVEEHGEHSFEQDMHIIELSGGYGDEYPWDLSTLTFVACGTCLKKWTSLFVEPPLHVSYGGHVTYEATHSETGETWVVDGRVAYPKGFVSQEPDHFPEGVKYPTEGVWEHYKGMRYTVLKSVLSGDKMNPEILVVYQGLYGDSPTFIRPARMWFEEVEHPEREGYLVPRFRLVP